MFQRTAATIFRFRRGHLFGLLILGLLGLARPAGAQSFTEPAPTITLNTFPATVSAVRVRDGVGPVDLVIPTEAGTFVLLGNGAGAFAATAGSPLPPANGGDFPEGAAVGNIKTATAHMDIATVNFISGDVSIYLGDGLGGFTGPTNFCTVPGVGACTGTPTQHPFNVAIARLGLTGTADAFPDLVITNNGANTVSVLPGTGTGTFGTPVTYPTGTGPEGLALADLNGDGILDLVVANYNAGQPPGSVSVLMGNADGTFQTKVDYPLAHAGARSVAIADLGNGKLDLVVGLGDGFVDVLLGTGTGTFGAAAEYPVGAGGLAPFGVAVGDFNVDGKPDVAVADQNPTGGDGIIVPFTYSITVLLGDGAGALTSPGTNFAVGTQPAYLDKGDFNGDGKADLAVGNQGAGNVSVLLNNVVLSADLAITKAGPATVAAGQNVVYTINVTNNGPNVAPAVSVADTTPAGLTFVSNAGACATAFPCPLLGPMPPGQTKTITSTYTVPLGYTGANPIVSPTATVSTANSTDGTPGNNTSGTVSTTVTFSTDLAITKAGPATVAAGQNVVYTITVTNNGPNTASGVTVADATPAGLTFVSNAGACTVAFPCTTLGPMISGQTSTITSTYTVPAAYGGANPIVNTATVSSTGANTTDPTPGNNTSTPTSTAVTFSADLAITKAGPVSVTAGTNVVYTITVTNNAGPNTATAVSVADTTPAGLTFVSNTGACATAFPCGALGPMTAGQVKTINSTYAVPIGYTGANPIMNTATVSSTSSTDPTPGNNSSTSATPVVLAADLAITKVGPANVVVGQNVVYTITVTNNGPNDAAAVSVADTTPAGLVFVSNTGACATAFPCTALGPMTVGQVKTITSTYTVPAAYTTPNPILNTATVSSSTTTDPTAGNSTATASTTVSFSADLAISKAGPASVNAGQNVVYTITVTNNGPNSATAVVVADTTPAGLTFVSNTGACATAFPCNGLGPMTSGQVKTITATYTVPLAYTGANPILNTATVTATTPNTTDPNPGNNTSTTSTGLGAASADLAITKTGPASVFRGGSIVYTITVTNNGPTDAAGVSVADLTPTGLTFVSNAGACSTVFPCALGSVQAGTTRSITSTFAIPAGYAGPAPVVNSATVTSTTTDPTPGNNTASFSSRLDPMKFYTLSPCRVFDTRDSTGAPSLVHGDTRAFTITGAVCGVPATAQAVSVTLTVTNPTNPGDLRMYPAGGTQPSTSAINYGIGQTRANNAVLPLGTGGAIDVFCEQGAGSADLILDVNGYFAP